MPYSGDGVVSSAGGGHFSTRNRFASIAFGTNGSKDFLGVDPFQYSSFLQHEGHAGSAAYVSSVAHAFDFGAARQAVHQPQYWGSFQSLETKKRKPKQQNRNKSCKKKGASGYAAP